jgi:hypothetical protein
MRVTRKNSGRTSESETELKSKQEALKSNETRNSKDILEPHNTVHAARFLFRYDQLTGQIDKFEKVPELLHL